jgi:hypothetical protein
MTYTLQELEALCDRVRNPETIGEYVTSFEALRGAALVAIPELIARIRELDPSFSASPPEGSTMRAMRLSREAGERRAKLASAVEAAKMGSLEELNALGLEAYFEDDGTVKIRQKRREQAERLNGRKP